MAVEQINQSNGAKHFLVPFLNTKAGRITAMAYCPYFLFVLCMTLADTASTLKFLIPPYIITIFVTDYFFEIIWKKEVSKLLKKTDWTCESNHNINYWISQLSVFSCAFVEVLLVYTAVNLGYSPTLTFTLLVGAKILGAPIQGRSCDLWKRKPNFIFCMIVSMGTILVLQQSHDIKAAVLWLLLIKGFLGNLDSIARAIIADERKIKF